MLPKSVWAVVAIGQILKADPKYQVSVKGLVVVQMAALPASTAAAKRMCPQSQSKTNAVQSVPKIT